MTLIRLPVGAYVVVDMVRFPGIRKASRVPSETRLLVGKILILLVILATNSMNVAPLIG